MLECLIGLVESQTIDRDRAFRNFEEWVLAKFGAGVAKHFMDPYNFKVWATPLDRMGFYWIAERVAVVDWKKALETTLSPKDTDWGPNAKFGYPATARDARSLAGACCRHLGDRVRYRKRAVLRRRGEARDRVHRRNAALLRPAADDPAARSLRRAPRARAGEGARGRRAGSSSTASSPSASA